MTISTCKISIRLDAGLHEKMQALAKVHPRRSMTAVIERLIIGGLSENSAAEAHIYVEAAVANLAVMLNLLLRLHKVDPDDVLPEGVGAGTEFTNANNATSEDTFIDVP